ncbi:ankyrin repeat domain-containing protein [Leifsonia shinshuensis]|uniref:ankyrin repeat domain-containing protein n=1 Tax=Leifsonia shinshuensis TaxID=150026 RepID=UPI001F50D404|nr:ankyrin repeat domain-containing protein [Leifsonia shinshuensis]MCI0158738.1 ankyrin repeat domain-containing protein [Leifsonia shinshuensis]
MNTGDEFGRKPIHYAALEDDAVSISRLLGEGESPDSRDNKGFTPLHFAAREFALRAAEVLLSAGAAVDAEDVFGNTPLGEATFNSKGRGEMIGLLRAHGADPLHANKSGQTCLGLSRLIANYPVARFFADVQG